jgi:hypothetical protein
MVDGLRLINFETLLSLTSPFQLITLLEEKTVIVKLGESQLSVALKMF